MRRRSQEKEVEAMFGQRYLAVATLLVCLCAQASFAAVTGRISGTVKDPTGAVVPNVQVIAAETLTGITTETKSDSAGFYAFPSLPVGHYELTVHAGGFKDYKQTGIVLDVN